MEAVISDMGNAATFCAIIYRTEQAIRSRMHKSSHAQSDFDKHKETALD